MGQSPALQRALQAATRLADKDVSVLVRGETGTGKELFASLLHARSRRAGKPLLKFNCAAIPHDLAEAQLFGYVRGAFTGASNAHQGYFVQAHGGTLVFALIERPAVGSAAAVAGSAAALTHDGSAAAAGERSTGGSVIGGSVAGGAGSGAVVSGGPGRAAPAGSGAERASPDSAPPPKAGGPSFREQMEAFERNLLVSALMARHNNQSEAARRLGMNRATLYDRLKKYSLLPEAARDG